jgi:hypothetical protein
MQLFGVVVCARKRKRIQEGRKVRPDSRPAYADKVRRDLRDIA